MVVKRLPPSLDAALSQVNPERRRLLGILLAGAAALPLLNSTSLAAEDKTADKSTVKHGPLDDKATTAAPIKSSTNSKTMTWVKGGVTADDSAIKSSTTSSSHIGGVKSTTQTTVDTRVKTSMPIKSAVDLKTQSAPLKSSTAPVKSNNTPK